MDNSLLNNLETFKIAVDSAFNHIIITDLDGKILYANRAVTRITGYSQEEVIGSTPRLWGGLMDPEFYKEMWHTIRDLGQPYSGEVDNKRKNGEIYHAVIFISPIKNKEGKIVGYIGTEDDITSIKKAQNELQKKKDTLEKIDSYMVDRELKMMKLKLELETLRDKITPHL